MEFTVTNAAQVEVRSGGVFRPCLGSEPGARRAQQAQHQRGIQLGQALQSGPHENMAATSQAGWNDSCSNVTR